MQNFYLIGRDKKKTFWRILKIDRTDPNELNLFEDPTRYTHEQIVELKKWISRGNQEYGGLRAETTCYGIIGTEELFLQALLFFFFSMFVCRLELMEILLVQGL